MLWFMFSGWISALVCVRFLESQLRGQHSQQEEELKALQQQLSQAISGSSSGAQHQVLTYYGSHLWHMNGTVKSQNNLVMKHYYYVRLELIVLFKNSSNNFLSLLTIYTFLLFLFESWFIYLWIINLEYTVCVLVWKGLAGTVRDQRARVCPIEERAEGG